jgi:hypothetical protein
MAREPQVDPAQEQDVGLVVDHQDAHGSSSNRFSAWEDLFCIVRAG